MANVKIHIPIWTQNQATGKYGWEYASVSATIGTGKADEGEPCISTKAMTKVPPKRMQPDPAP